MILHSYSQILKIRVISFCVYTKKIKIPSIPISAFNLQNFIFLTGML